MQSLSEKIVNSLRLNVEILESDKKANQILKDLITSRVHSIIKSNKNAVRAIARTLTIGEYFIDQTLIVVSNDWKSILVGQLEDEILWLDNHYGNNDFAKWLFEIGITEYIFSESIPAHDLANIILETKLVYLANPKLIKNVSDIPQRHPPSAKVASISNQISAPLLQKTNDGEAILLFYFWTKQLGYVCEAKIVFRSPYLMEMKLQVLAGSVGEFIPRLLGKYS